MKHFYEKTTYVHSTSLLFLLRQKHDRREIVAERQAFVQESVFFLEEVGVASHLRRHGLEELVGTLLQDDLANVDR